MPAWMPLAMAVTNGGPTGVAGGVVAVLDHLNPDKDTPQFSAFRRVNWAAVAWSQCCRPQRRSLMPNSASIAS
jgi:hypothetical protein